MTSLAICLAGLFHASVWSQSSAASNAQATSPGKAVPIELRARSVTAKPDFNAQAEGDVEFRQGPLVIRADQLRYETLDDLATAQGHVRVDHEDNIYSGSELQIKVQQFEGHFIAPTYQLGRIGAGGSARRIDFLDKQRALATQATYSSCPNDGVTAPAWQLSTDNLRLDFAANEGLARGAVLRLYGVPILAAPRLSFPLTDARKSGWLPPSLGLLDTRSGPYFSIPYYWNIAPNYDATLTPAMSVRRGVSLDSEFRYLQPGYNGDLRLNLMPRDRLTNAARHAFSSTHNQDFGDDLQLQLRLLRVSDNDYWKDFPRDLTSLTPRLLASNLQLNQLWGPWTGYARVQRWQVLQTTDLSGRITAPYERLPQLGLRYAERLGSLGAWGLGFPAGLDVSLEAEFNRFTNPPDATLAPRPTGTRWHGLGSISWPYATPGWTLTPKLLFSAAAYSLDSQGAGTLRTQNSRFIPSLSVDSAWVFERDTQFLGSNARQTLEPRVLYVNTPYRDQTGLPNFDASAKDFNLDSIFSENAYAGVDRVSDAHQITAGIATRVLNPDTGAERMRLGLAQRYLLRDQLVTPDGQPLKQRYSDLLLLGSTALIPRWTLDASVQYSPETHRTTRSVVGARYSPGPFRTVSATYRLARGLSEQVELGWQWPLYGATPDQAVRNTSANSSCKGSWYGVGRVKYSTLERRLIDSVAGLEYDAGCWVGRIVVTRLSAGRSEATTRLSFQLELAGLSRLNLGANPLQVLKDNVPGYQLLRDGRAQVQAPASLAPLPLSEHD
jgi:LPS-assembly protein